MFWLAVCLGLSWTPPALAVSVERVSKFGGHTFTSVVTGPDGSLFVFVAVPHSALLRVAADGTTTTVYTGPTTVNPPLTVGPLALASDGNFYGVVRESYLSSTGQFIYGAITRLTPAGEFSFVHEFVTEDGVGAPAPGLVQGNDGALYGTGAYSDASPHGMVFRCTLDGTVASIHNFADGAGYTQSLGRLTLGKDGNLYGATNDTLYQVTPSGGFTALHTLPGGERANLNSGFVQDAEGNFYGTAAGNPFDYDGGMVYRFTPKGEFTILHTFPPANAYGTDGSVPAGPLTAAPDGNFYGVTSGGGTQYGGGTIFKVTPAGAVSVVYRAYSQGLILPKSLIAGADGKLYGTNEGSLLRIETKSAGTFGFNTDRFSVSPNAGSAFITVSRSDGASGNVSVAYTTVDHTAYAGTDYTGTTGVLTWADGDDSTKNIRVLLTSHGEINGSSLDFTVQLSNPTGGAVLGEPSSAQVVLNGFAGLYQTQAGMAPLFVFSRGLDGDMVRRVFVGTDGNFYGSTSTGGIGGSGNTFRLTPSGDMTILAANTFLEVGGLSRGTDGNFYGTAAPNNAPTSRLFRLIPGGIPTSLYDLGLRIVIPQRAAARRTLLQTRDGQFYGTLQDNSGYPAAPPTEAIFRVNPDGTQTTLYTVTDGLNVNLTEGADDNLYAVVQQGGQHGNGYLFRLDRGGRFTRLYDFNAANGGAAGPMGSLIPGPDGALYGLTGGGGAGNAGTFYRLKTQADKVSKPKILHSFDARQEGTGPQDDLLLGADGNFYGTLATPVFGSNSSTTFFRLSITGDLTVLYHSAPHDRPLTLLTQGSDRAFYFQTEDLDPDAILRFDPDSVGKITVQIAETGSSFSLGIGKGLLRLSRSGDVSQALTVQYSVGGSALAGRDYKALSGLVTFLPGHFDAAIKIKALSTVTSGSRLRIKLRPLPDGVYVLVPGRDKVLLEFVAVKSSG